MTLVRRYDYPARRSSRAAPCRGAFPWRPPFFLWICYDFASILGVDGDIYRQRGIVVILDFLVSFLHDFGRLSCVF